MKIFHICPIFFCCIIGLFGCGHSSKEMMPLTSSLPEGNYILIIELKENKMSFKLNETDNPKKVHAFLHDFEYDDTTGSVCIKKSTINSRSQDKTRRKEFVIELKPIFSKSNSYLKPQQLTAVADIFKQKFQEKKIDIPPKQCRLEKKKSNIEATIIKYRVENENKEFNDFYYLLDSIIQYPLKNKLRQLNFPFWGYSVIISDGSKTIYQNHIEFTKPVISISEEFKGKKIVVKEKPVVFDIPLIRTVELSTDCKFLSDFNHKIKDNIKYDVFIDDKEIKNDIYRTKKTETSYSLDFASSHISNIPTEPEATGDFIHPVTSQTTASLTASTQSTPIPKTGIFTEDTFGTIPLSSEFFGHTLEITSTPESKWLTVDPGVQIIKGTPTFNDIGMYTITVSSADKSISKIYLIKVNERNDPPEKKIDIPDQYAREGIQFEYQIPSNTFVDEENNYFSYSVDNLPDWLTFNSDDRTLLGTPSHQNIGTHRITVTAKEAESGLKTSTSFQITVQKNEYPVSMNLQNLNYSANDFIYFYKNEADCKNPKARSIDSLFFTEAYLSEYRAKETYWAKVRGKNQLSNCARGIVQNEMLKYNLSRITRPNQKKILFIISNSEALSQMIAREKLWRVIEKIVIYTSKNKINVEFLSLNERKKLVSMFQSDSIQPENNRLSVKDQYALKDYLPFEHGIIKPFKAMRDAVQAKFDENNILKIIYLVDSKYVESEPEESFNVPTIWIKNKLLHVFTDKYCSVWENQVLFSRCTTFSPETFGADLFINILKTGLNKNE